MLTINDLNDLIDATEAWQKSKPVGHGHELSAVKMMIGRDLPPEKRADFEREFGEAAEKVASEISSGKASPA